MSFYEFLEESARYDTPEGDFARDAVRDTAFPQTDDPFTILEYLEYSMVDGHLIDLCKELWRTWWVRSDG